VKNLVDREAMSLLLKNPTIQGIKDSSGDLVRFQELLELRVERSGFQVWQGAEALAALSIIRGADGAVLGLANIAPALCCQLYQAAAHGDLTAAWALQNRLLHLYRIQEHRSFLAGLKTAAMQLGLCRARVTEPFEPLDQSQQAAVRRTLVELGLLPE